VILTHQEAWYHKAVVRAGFKNHAHPLGSSSVLQQHPKLFNHRLLEVFRVLSHRQKVTRMKVYPDWSLI